MKIGEMVTYTHKPIRVSSGNKRSWNKTKVEPSEAMYIGYRYISDGVFLCGGSDYEYFEFVKENMIKVWLVVKNDRTNPFYVYPNED